MRYTAAFFLGALMSLAMPPVGGFPVLLLCVPGFIVLTRAASTRLKAFLAAWVFGAGYFIAGLYWISVALFVDIRMWGWALPLSLVVGPALYALYYGLIPLLAWPCRHNKLSHALATIAAWSIIEWLRGHLFTGFPWNLLGYTWMHHLSLMQVSAYIGIYGLTLLTLLWAAVPVMTEKRKLVEGLVISFLAFTILGLVRLQFSPTALTGHTIRIVQANIPQGQKWDPDQDWRNIEKHVLLSSMDESKADAVIWPETAFVAHFDSWPEIARFIAIKLPPESLGIFGALRVTPPEKEGDEAGFHNSILALDKDTRSVEIYDKHHLVPFGEYIPYREKLNVTPIAAAISNVGEFTSGNGPRTLKPRGKLPPFSPLVCYEVIFPHEVTPRNNRPEWLVNVTNDGWYGNSFGPYQHFEIARVRAIEEGLPLARAANTGISGMIDPLGRVLALQPLGTTGYVETGLPTALPPTLYARLGDVPFLAMFVLLALLAVRGSRSYPTLQ